MYFVREFMHQLMEALEYVHRKRVGPNAIVLYLPDCLVFLSQMLFQAYV